MKLAEQGGAYIFGPGRQYPLLRHWTMHTMIRLNSRFVKDQRVDLLSATPFCTAPPPSPTHYPPTPPPHPHPPTHTLSYPISLHSSSLCNIDRTLSGTRSPRHRFHLVWLDTKGNVFCSSV